MFYICNVQHSSWQPEVTTEPWNVAAVTKEWDFSFYLILINTNFKSHMFSGDHTERCRSRLSYENVTTVSVPLKVVTTDLFHFRLIKQHA